MAKKKEIKEIKLTASQLEEEIKRVTYNSRYKNLLRTTIYTIIVIAAISALLATLIMPVLEVKGNSMQPTYKNGDITIAFKTKKINQGDIISFYYGNKILVKRVIAGSGDWVNIKEGIVYVNGEALKESYVNDNKYDIGDIKYPYQVPDGQWFVLSDNRVDTQDSRYVQIGCVKNDDVVGKILFRLFSQN